MEIIKKNNNQTSIVNDLDKFSKFLSQLITACEKIQTDIQVTKSDLRRAKWKAEEAKRKATEVKCQLAVANVGLGIATFATVIFSGGLALPVLLLSSQMATVICSHKNDQQYNRNIKKIIRAVDERSDNSMQRSLMVIKKKNTYQNTLKTMKAQGINEKEAVFYAICGMINDMIDQNNRTFIMDETDEPFIDLSQICFEETDLINRISEQKNVGFMGISLASAEKWLPEWLTNSTQKLAGQIPKFTPKLAGAATSIITAGVELYYVIRFIKAENQAVELIDNTIKVLDEGEESLNYFIEVFNSVRINALQELKNERIREMKLKHIYYSITIISIVFLVLAFTLALIKL